MRAGLLFVFALVLALVGALLWRAHPDQGEVEEAERAAGEASQPAGEGRRTPALPRRSGAAEGQEPARADEEERFRAEQSVFASPAQPYRLARDAYRHGDYPLAYRRALEALRLGPDERGPRILAVLSACAMSEEEEAQSHADALEERAYRDVLERCERLGVQLTPRP